MFANLPDSVLQMSMIFLSIVIEAVPFVLLGCLISGALQVFLTPSFVRRILPKNPFLATVMGCFLGVFFPSCECGIVPIVHQFVKKEVPLHTAFAFMLTAPIVNPIVIFSTFIAFGNSWHYALLRVAGAVFVAMVVGVWLAYFPPKKILKDGQLPPQPIKGQANAAEIAAFTHEKGVETATAKNQLTAGATCQVATLPADPLQKGLSNISHLLKHSLDEFFDTGRYLMLGALIAAGMQTYLPTATLLTLGSNRFLALLVLLALAFIMSLCSEADAFIGSSLLSLFGSGPVVAFLVFGPMVDLKNLLMMKRYFKGQFILKLVGLIVLCVLLYGLVVTFR